MIILGLGSNIEDRRAYLKQAIAALADVMTDIRLSRVFESAPLLPEGASPDWDKPFLNMVVSGRTNLSPQALLAAVKDIEQKLGRQKRGTWGPREIDIDIIAMDEVVMHTPDLTIPHPQMMERDFVLLPLLDIAPDWVCPNSKRRAADVVAQKQFALHEGLRDTGEGVL